jgi:hypothetical protein
MCERTETLQPPLDSAGGEKFLPHSSNKFPLPPADTILGVWDAVLPGGYNALELGPGSNTPAFVKTISLKDIDGWQNNLCKTFHHNLMNIVDICATKDDVYLSYKPMDTSLKELQHCTRSFFDRVTVTSICTEV